MSEARMSYLLERYFNKTCTPAEREELSALLLEAGNDEALKALLEKTWTGYSPGEQLPAAAADRYFENIMQKAAPPESEAHVRPLRPRSTAWLRYAAAVVLVAGTAAWFGWRSKRPAPLPPAPTVQLQHDKAPGRPGAILTLADGTQVELDSLGKGVIAQQNGTQVVLGNGQLLYNPGGAAATGVSYNTMTTPRGRQFQLLLPDGSKVWLNAASTIRYPTSFAGNERVVEMEGEAYFEVTKDAARPFRVKLNNGAAVEVLGTHFNVNSYADENNITTTLLEGAVRMSTGAGEALLQPGQQAQAGRAQAQLKVIKHADVERVMAWKNGYFRFDGMDLPMVMRQIARWYDVEVEYKGPVPRKQFGGELPRSVSLQRLLNLIAFGDVKLEVTGNRITVIGQ